MGRMFRLHDRMAGHAAELGRLHVVDALVRGTREDDDVEHRCADEDQRPALRRRLVEIENRHRLDGLVTMRPPQLAAVKQRTDNAVTGERLLRRAEETAMLSYTQDIGAHRFGASLFASGEREDFGGVELPGYVLANLTAQFNLGDVWALHARIENLLDTEYETAAGFRMQERGGFVELKYRWK